MNAILMLLLTAVPAGQAVPVGQTQSAAPTNTLTADAASQQKQPDVLLLDFTADYCDPCRQMLPVIERMQRQGYPVRQIDISKEPHLARRFSIARVPTFVLLVEGREVRRFQGLMSESHLCDEMQKAARELREDRLAAQQDQPIEPSQAPDHESNTFDSTPSPREKADPKYSGIFGGSKLPNGFQRPLVRAQSPEPQNVDNAGAMASTVRVRVSGKDVANTQLQDVGTGTIIYSQNGRSLILTCAHLFSAIQRDPVVEIDVFADGRPTRYPAKILAGSFKSDLAILELTSQANLPVAQLNRDSSLLKSGQKVMSLGCDNGLPPSTLQSRILKINQFNGPSNLTCEKDPVQGRSGGGLFDTDGMLIAVCSAADRESKQGLYMSMPAIVELLDRAEVNHLIAVPGLAQGEEILPESLFPESAAPTTQKDEQFAEVPSALEKAPRVANADSSSPDFGGPSSESTGPAAPGAGRSANVGSSEVRITIRSDDPAVGNREIVLPRMSPWLLELLTGEVSQASEASFQSVAARRPVLNARPR